MSGDVGRVNCEEALDVVKSSDDSGGWSSAIHVLSVAAQMSGDLNTARDLMLQRIEIARKRGALSVVSYEASNLSAGATARQPRKRERAWTRSARHRAPAQRQMGDSLHSESVDCRRRRDR